MVFLWGPAKERSSVYSELNELSEQLMAKGVAAISYHITPPFYSQVSQRSSVFHSGYPEDIVSGIEKPDKAAPWRRKGLTSAAKVH